MKVNIRLWNCLIIKSSLLIPYWYDILYKREINNIKNNSKLSNNTKRIYSSLLSKPTTELNITDFHFLYTKQEIEYLNSLIFSIGKKEIILNWNYTDTKNYFYNNADSIKSKKLNIEFKERIKIINKNLNNLEKIKKPKTCLIKKWFQCNFSIQNHWYKWNNSNKDCYLWSYKPYYLLKNNILAKINEFLINFIIFIGNSNEIVINKTFDNLFSYYKNKQSYTQNKYKFSELNKQNYFFDFIKGIKDNKEKYDKILIDNFAFSKNNNTIEFKNIKNWEILNTIENVDQEKTNYMSKIFQKKNNIELYVVLIFFCFMSGYQSLFPWLKYNFLFDSALSEEELSKILFTIKFK